MFSIDFKLRPLAEVVPWGDLGDLSLSWFGLSDGSYHINANGDRLFQYTSEILDFLSPDHFIKDRLDDCADYQVVRLYEDMLELLPNAMAPVPHEIHALISGVEACRSWKQKLSWAYEIDDDEELNELYWQATDWFGYRKLDSLYLTDGPDIRFWRFQDDIFIQWDNKGKETNGIPRWTAQSGSCSLPVNDFLNELETFHSRFMHAMAERVKDIQDNNPLPNLRIDIPNLVREHEERSQSLERAMKFAPEAIDWDLTIKANAELSRKKA